MRSSDIGARHWQRCGSYWNLWIFKARRGILPTQNPRWFSSHPKHFEQCSIMNDRIHTKNRSYPAGADHQNWHPGHSLGRFSVMVCFGSNDLWTRPNWCVNVNNVPNMVRFVKAYLDHLKVVHVSLAQQSAETFAHTMHCITSQDSIGPYTLEPGTAQLHPYASEPPLWLKTIWISVDISHMNS